MPLRSLQPEELAGVPARLERISNQPDWHRVFGATDHCYILNNPLSEIEILAFEDMNKVSLPADYRFFLRNVGNGGAGPDYGIFNLGTWEGGKTWAGEDWLVGKLDEPFPYSTAWNPVPFDPERDDPDDDILDAIEDEYFATKHIDGSIPISTQGCRKWYRLVVAGPAYGQIWLDRLVDWRGLSPVQQSFSGWYLDWLSEAERTVGLGSPQPLITGPVRSELRPRESKTMSQANRRVFETNRRHYGAGRAKRFVRSRL